MAAPLLVTIFGAALIGVVLSREYLAFVRPAMAAPLVLTGCVLVGLGAWSLASAPGGSEGDSGGGHGAHLPRSAWLLVVPVLVSILLSPPPLGSALAQRRDPLPPAPRSANGFGALPPGDPLGIPLPEYAERATAGGEATLEGRRFTITGFVTPAAEGGWLLTRVRIRCCAADATPVFVRAVGAEAQLADRWVTITGSYLPAARGIAQLEVTALEAAEPPPEPYVIG